MSQGYLIPPIDESNAGFWEGTRRGELCVEQCAGCETLRFPPRPMCPVCHATGRRWVPVSGRGSIWSFVVPHPPLLAQFSEIAHFNVIVVSLEENPALRMVSNLVSTAGNPIRMVDPAKIEINARVRVVFEALSESLHFPRWTLV